jgi:hypothetical protein
LYEIKYWPSPVSKAAMSRLFKQAKNNGELYENTFFINFRFKIIIVSTNENLEKVKREIADFFNPSTYSLISLEFFSEDDLLV